MYRDAFGGSRDGNTRLHLAFSRFDYCSALYTLGRTDDGMSQVTNGVR